MLIRKNYNWLLIAVVALIASSSSSAIAVPITFTFTGGTGQQAPSFTFTKPGITLTVKSNTANESGSTLTAAGKVGKWPQGLGILDGQSGDEHYVDGKGKNDVLSFFFSQSVKLLSIGFSYVDSNDDFAFFFDKNKNGVLQNDLVWKTKDIPGSGPNGTFSFATLTDKYIGKLFGIGAYEDNDEFKVAFITVDFVKPSTIPLPGALPLFVAGLAGLGLMRRRRPSHQL